ncbi:MAG: hypothetical protein HQM02_01555 [Magnetococcales bacterium]|nr:hypothetical protein [Magnetococcales bacterium]
MVHATTWIDLRFVVNEALGVTTGQQGATRRGLEHAVETLNNYFKVSDVVLRARIVDVSFVRMGGLDAVEILDDMSNERHGFAHLFAQASRLGADYTVAVTQKLLMRGKPGCGRALAVNQTREALASTRKALLVMNYACGAHTLAHELGHLMGLNHGAMVDACEPGKGHTSAMAPYANGFGQGNCDRQPQPGEFGDIMVGGWMGRVAGNDKGSLPFFSNPRLRDSRCGSAQICGDPDNGDAARALNENAGLYASHEEEAPSP